MGFEYDPHNALRHTTYWYETDAADEWPAAKNASSEQAPQPEAPFDHRAQASTFYFDVETVGSMSAREVVLTVSYIVRRHVYDIACSN